MTKQPGVTKYTPEEINGALGELMLPDEEARWPADSAHLARCEVLRACILGTFASAEESGFEPGVLQHHLALMFHRGMRVSEILSARRAERGNRPC